ncbi:hypothetical protein GN956_G23091 [Arapaima gigas]
MTAKKEMRTSRNWHAWERVLEAQVILGAQACNQRRAHRRRAQELHGQRQQRRAARVVVTGNAEAGMDKNGNHLVQLVKRHAERNIFWDGLNGENSAYEDLLRPNTGCLKRKEADTSQMKPRNLLEDESLLKDPLTCSAEHSHLQRMISVDDRLTIPWMLDSEGSKQRQLSSRGRSGLDIQPRHEIFSQRQKKTWGRNRTSLAVDQWEFGPQISEHRVQCGRLNKTRAEAIPSFENHLGLDFEHKQVQ